MRPRSALLAYHGRLSWQSQGSSQWLGVAQWVIERGVWGSDVWQAWDLHSYHIHPPNNRSLGVLAYGNSYAVRVYDRINTLRTGYSEVVRIDVPMPEPVIERLVHEPELIPVGVDTAVRLEVHGRDLSPEMEWLPETKPARVLLDSVEQAGFYAGTHVIHGWLEPDVLTPGAHAPRTLDAASPRGVAPRHELVGGGPRRSPARARAGRAATSQPSRCALRGSHDRSQPNGVDRGIDHETRTRPPHARSVSRR
jgi:hypothetical protein